MKTIVSTCRFCLIGVLMSLLPLPDFAAGYTEFEIEHVRHFKLFRQLYDEGPDSAFYEAAANYERFLRNAGKEEEYFKIKCNEGFYDVNHHHMIRAMKTANLLDKEIHEAGMADELGYLPLGLLGDINKASHNMKRALEFYEQALEQAGDHDKKFSLEKYISMAEMVYLSAPEQALEYADKALKLSEEIDDIEYKAKGLALKGFVHFLNGKSEAFYSVYNGYEALRSMEHPRFSHRYDNLMLAARLAFDHDYFGAESLATTKKLNIDRSLVLLKIYAMEGNVQKGFNTITHRVVELDSMAASIQELNLNDMEAEMEMNRLKTEATNNRRLATRTMMALVVLTFIFLIVYFATRRYLIKKIRARNKELEVARDKAEESDRMKTAFIRNMSHEIRTPLNAINGFSQVLCSPAYELDDDERTNLQQRITENVDSITEIVKELLDMSKGESEALKSEVAPLVVCRRVVQQAEQKNVNGLEIRFDSPLPELITFQCHEQNLEQILTRLMDNALKFTEKGSILLECYQQGALMMFRVTDTGIGVKAEEHDHIFETFVKLDQYKGGVGLGLAVCRRLAHLMGGDVTLDTQYTEGARFLLSLPL